MSSVLVQTLGRFKAVDINKETQMSRKEIKNDVVTLPHVLARKIMTS